MGQSKEFQQVKSRERVREHGEVFTAEREVKAMCDLVKEETERIDSRFLEPTCGDGNFLAEILRRKLAVCERQYGQSSADWEKFSFLAMTSIYGIDILADNVEACRERLLGEWRSWARKRPCADAQGARPGTQTRDRVQRLVESRRSKGS